MHKQLLSLMLLLQGKGRPPLWNDTPLLVFGLWVAVACYRHHKTACHVDTKFTSSLVKYFFSHVNTSVHNITTLWMCCSIVTLWRKNAAARVTSSFLSEHDLFTTSDFYSHLNKLWYRYCDIVIDIVLFLGYCDRLCDKRWWSAVSPWSRLNLSNSSSCLLFAAQRSNIFTCPRHLDLALTAIELIMIHFMPRSLYRTSSSSMHAGR